MKISVLSIEIFSLYFVFILTNIPKYINKSLKEIENPTPAEYVAVIDRTEEYNPDDDELLTENAGHDLDDDNEDTDDELLENDSDKDEDIDDERNDKLELVMKCIGIGIAVIILMITIFVVIKLVGNGKNTARFRSI